MTIGMFFVISLVVISSPNREYLFFGTFLSVSLTGLIALGLLNLFLRSELLFDIYIYLGLFVFAGYIAYDTQLMIEKAKSGNMDMVTDALGLFLDFISIFIRFVIFCARNQEKKK